MDDMLQQMPDPGLMETIVPGAVAFSSARHFGRSRRSSSVTFQPLRFAADAT